MLGFATTALLAFNPAVPVGTNGVRAAIFMAERSNWAALDDGAPLGILEKDAAVVFGMLDEDGDGSITRAEMTTRLLACDYTEERINKVFDKIDLDASGDISAEEWGQAYVKFPTLRTAP